MSGVLSVVWFASAIGGVLASLAAAGARRLRRSLLVVAGALFGVAGVLGILSVGVVFLALAAWCFVAANRTAARTAAGRAAS